MKFVFLCCLIWTPSTLSQEINTAALNTLTQPDSSQRESGEGNYYYQKGLEQTQPNLLNGIEGKYYNYQNYKARGGETYEGDNPSSEEYSNEQIYKAPLENYDRDNLPPVQPNYQVHGRETYEGDNLPPIPYYNDQHYNKSPEDYTSNLEGRLSSSNSDAEEQSNFQARFNSEEERNNIRSSFNSEQSNSLDLLGANSRKTDNNLQARSYEETALQPRNLQTSFDVTVPPGVGIEYMTRLRVNFNWLSNILMHLIDFFGAFVSQCRIQTRETLMALLEFGKSFIQDTARSIKHIIVGKDFKGIIHYFHDLLGGKFISDVFQKLGSNLLSKVLHPRSKREVQNETSNFARTLKTFLQSEGSMKIFLKSGLKLIPGLTKFYPDLLEEVDSLKGPPQILLFFWEAFMKIVIMLVSQTFPHSAHLVKPLQSFWKAAKKPLLPFVGKVYAMLLKAFQTLEGSFVKKATRGGSLVNSTTHVTNHPSD